MNPPDFVRMFADQTGEKSLITLIVKIDLRARGSPFRYYYVPFARESAEC